MATKPDATYEYVWDGTCANDMLAQYTPDVIVQIKHNADGTVTYLADHEFNPLGQCRVRYRPLPGKVALCINGCGRQFRTRQKRGTNGLYFVWIDEYGRVNNHRYELKQDTSTPLSVFDSIGNFSDIECLQSQTDAPVSDDLSPADVFQKWASGFGTSRDT